MENRFVFLLTVPPVRKLGLVFSTYGSPVRKMGLVFSSPGSPTVSKKGRAVSKRPQLQVKKGAFKDICNSTSAIRSRQGAQQLSERGICRRDIIEHDYFREVCQGRLVLECHAIILCYVFKVSHLPLGATDRSNIDNLGHNWRWGLFAKFPRSSCMWWHIRSALVAHKIIYVEELLTWHLGVTQY